ncbi:hypothetical protein OBV_04920 [Oscillibacter valericigenes Sjm18-20]|nr:hypothetical protein OBV_04920 [Oscillibacter valericigenes Sjm18-20]
MGVPYPKSVSTFGGGVNPPVFLKILIKLLQYVSDDAFAGIGVVAGGVALPPSTV